MVTNLNISHYVSTSKISVDISLDIAMQFHRDSSSRRNTQQACGSNVMIILIYFLWWSFQAVTLTDEEIVEMVFFGVVNEACRVLEEDIVVRSADLDIASVLGMGFPSYRYYLCYLQYFMLRWFCRGYLDCEHKRKVNTIYQISLGWISSCQIDPFTVHKGEAWYFVGANLSDLG